ncbi:hypothetical protein NLG97_g6839 [Lecanicillium saksenae]|uniref:Uncharacterized protein n=1 Tax=Lecanicillium saksenae TaxID=468837 RepID=A0ACC1QQ40_9HYPO|nr:hypothetical protein NLG97_g6839 [Lecanicillium saksenae]
MARFVDCSSVSSNSSSGSGADALVLVPMRGSGLTSLEYDWIECQRDMLEYDLLTVARSKHQHVDILVARISLLMMTPDALCKDWTSAPNLAITHPVWPPDFTMTGRVRQCFGKWLMRRSPFESTPFRKDPSEARHKFDAYTGQALLELSRDIAEPSKYAEKQVVKRVAIHIASDISLCSRDLRRHLEGFIAVLKASGGMQTVMETKQLHKISLWLIMM